MRHRLIKTAQGVADWLKLRATRSESGCLICHLKPNTSGYSLVQYSPTIGNREREYVHRLVFSVANGPIPSGLVVRHSCDNRRCIELQHLKLGTYLDNNMDTINRGRMPSIRLKWAWRSIHRQARRENNA